ncbi:uncharacterized protein BJX67DRAFT_378832 [Aspergillus lucknowensis]|uniref:NlpC/P60 domain-containing protein n=1 Tax=Aspergillus lucknowensis TaxID=176173 RepID=A0ABR4LYZ8_9EURO
MPSLSLLAVTAALPLVNAYLIIGDGVNCRSGPGTSYDVVTSYALNTDVTLDCQAPGEDIYGDPTWDKTSDGCYVADYYVDTNGADKYVVEACEPTGGDDGGNTGGGDGHAIVAKAQEELGLPYVWGGGGCDGPSGGGFDCSGLTQFAVCQTVGVTIPRVSADQYASSLGQRIPRAEAQEGDLIFWGAGGDCSGSNVEHVGIFIREGWMINAATTGTPVREQAIWEESGGLAICPDAIRFW